MTALVFALALAGCSGGPAAAGALEVDTRVERSERDVDVYLATQVEVARSSPVLQRALGRLGRQSDPDALRDRLSIERRGDSAVLDVRVSVAGDPEEATYLCNAVMAAYVEQRLHLARATLDEDEMDAIVNAGARILEPCRPPSGR